MNGEEGGARGISKEDETNADDKINKAGTEVEQPVAVIDRRRRAHFETTIRTRPIM